MPIDEFPKYAMIQLPEEKRKILIDDYDEIFAADVTYQKQIEIVCSLIYDLNRSNYCGPTAIGRLFGRKGSTISTHFARMKKDRKPTIGRPCSLDASQLEILVFYIRTRFEAKCPPNVFHLIDYCFDTFGLSI